MAIGFLAGAHEPLRGQETSPTGAAGAVSVARRDNPFRQRFEQLLVAAPTRDLAAGWQLARDLGRPVAPLLWDMVQREEADVQPRLALLVAAVIAGGPAEDERLLRFLDVQKPMLEERTMAGLLMAMAPARSRPAAEFWRRCLGPVKTQGTLLPIAVRLAAARFPGAADGAPVMPREDAGLLAATAFAGLPVPPAVAARFWEGKGEKHAVLFWRGALLGAARRPEPPTAQDGALEHARLLRSAPGDALLDVRIDATLLLARARQIDASGPRPADFRLLEAMVFDVASAQRVREWLQPAPQALNEMPQRLAVAYALSRPTEEVLAARGVWGGERSIQRHVAIALAFRVCGGPSVAPIDAVMPRLPEWNFVRWASGASFDRGVDFEDAVLQTLAVAIREDRMTPKVLRTSLEEVLWRWGSHPGRLRLEQEQLLIRDLLLSGSDPGGGRFQPHVPPHARYLPTGFDKDHVFFTVAVQAYEFLARSAPPVPAEFQLR
ncbi:MAG: hypothetical protein IT455_04145 [Planctomycetes bacterium]|nr:hypothetical protein [Planctomycetota bacterium]